EHRGYEFQAAGHANPFAIAPIAQTASMSETIGQGNPIWPRDDLGRGRISVGRTRMLTDRNALLLAAMLASSVAGFPAAAQQSSPAPAAQPSAPPAAAPLPPGSPLTGRRDTGPAAKRAPVAPPPLAAAADKLPTAKLKVPKGFNIEVFASGMQNARSMRIGDKGTVFAGSRLIDKVYAVVDK